MAKPKRKPFEYNFADNNNRMRFLQEGKHGDSMVQTPQPGIPVNEMVAQFHHDILIVLSPESEGIQQPTSYARKIIWLVVKQGRTFRKGRDKKPIWFVVCDGVTVTDSHRAEAQLLIGISSPL